MQTVIETITPAKAVEYLRTSRGNRPISKTAVKSYCDSMKRGKWMLNGVPIIFDDEGHLMDGHHRLNAIIQAGFPVQTWVCRGVSPEAFTTIDQGRGKHLGQLLAMQQVKHYNIVASIVNGNHSLIMSGRLLSNNGPKNKAMSNMDFYDEYQQDPAGFDEAGDIAAELNGKARILKAAWIGSLYYYLSHTGGYEKGFVKKFFEAACGLETSGIDVADELRNFIIRNDRKDRRLEASYLFAIVCKAWNAYAEGRVVKRYNFDSGRDTYPRLKLNTEG